jgi:hypothetical protein
MPGNPEFAPVPDDGTGRVTNHIDGSTVIVPTGAPGGEYRFRSGDGHTSRSIRVDNDFPPLGRGAEG